MTKKLRIRFISVCMLSLLAVIFTLLITINGLNAYRSVKKLDMLLSTISGNAGSIPFPVPHGDEKPLPGAAPPAFSPETPFTTRYFTVTADSDGNITDIDTNKIAAITAEDAEGYARLALASGKSKGWKGIYKYVVIDSDDGTKIIFIDGSNEIYAIRSLVRISCVVAAAAFAVMFALVFFFSKKAIRPIVESVEKQKQFITDAGHELKTPLTVISANAEILEMNYGKNKWTDSLKGQTARMRRLVESLVSLSRLDEERPPLEFKDFCISDAVFDTAITFSALAENAGKTLRTDIQPSVVCRGDEAAIRQLVSLLMDNSVKYCAPGGRIDVALTRERYISIRISNTYEQAGNLATDRLFDRFYRADEARTAGGYGLGLALAKSIVEAHRGTIQARSLDGAAVEFEVRL